MLILNSKHNLLEKYLKEFRVEANKWFAERTDKNDGFLKRFYDFYQKQFTSGFLSKENIKNISLENLIELSHHIHAFNSVEFAKYKAVGEETVSKKGIEYYGEQFFYLIYGNEKLSIRINKTIDNLYGFSISSISEIVSWASYFVDSNNKYIFYNKRSQNIIEFLGLTPEHKRGTKIGQKFISYNEVVDSDIKDLYSAIVGKLTDYEIELEIDQFFSWLYEKLKEEVKQISEIDICYLDELKVENYFNVDIELSDLNNKKEIYFLGENAHGKTLILQSILIALTRNYIEAFTKKETTGKIQDLLDLNKEALFISKGYDKKDEIEIPFIYESKKDEQNKTVDKIRAHFLKNIYAYGVFRSGASVRKDLKDSYEYGFMTLFDEQEYLIHPIQWLNEIDRKQSILNLKLNSILKILSDIFRNEIEIKKDPETYDFYFKEKQSETKLSFEQISAGYKTVLIWTCDLLARLAKNQPNVKKIEDYKAVVLVDEVDLFLHPKWEYEIVSILRKQFAGIQFFFTTHSAITILGASENAVVYKVYKDNNGIVKVSEPVKQLSGLTANSLLTSMIWDMSNFTTRGTKLNQVTDADYIYQKIYQEVDKKIKTTPNIIEDDVLNFINNELDKL